MILSRPVPSMSAMSVPLLGRLPQIATTFDDHEMLLGVYRDAQAMNCFELIDPESHMHFIDFSDSVILQHKHSRHHYMMERQIHMRWSGRPCFRFILPDEVVTSVQRACLSVQESVLNGLSIRLLGGRRSFPFLNAAAVLGLLHG